MIAETVSSAMWRGNGNEGQKYKGLDYKKVEFTL